MAGIGDGWADTYFQQRNRRDDERARKAAGKAAASQWGRENYANFSEDEYGNVNGFSDNEAQKANDAQVAAKTQPQFFEKQQSTLQKILSGGGSVLGNALKPPADAITGALDPHSQTRVNNIAAPAIAAGKAPPTYQEMMGKIDGAPAPAAKIPPGAAHYAGNGMPTSTDGGVLAQEAPSGPAPLLSNPKAEPPVPKATPGASGISQDELSQVSPTVSAQQKAGAPVTWGTDAQGRVIKVQPMNKAVAFDERRVEAPYEPAPEEAPPPEPQPQPPTPPTLEQQVAEAPPERLPLPSSYMMKRIVDLSTSGNKKDSDPSIPFATLPQKWQRDLGVEGEPGGAPASLIKQAMEAFEKKEGKGNGDGYVSPLVTSLAEKVRVGDLSLGAAIRAANSENGGISKAEMKILEGQAHESSVDKRSKDNRDAMFPFKEAARVAKEEDQVERRDNKFDDRVQKFQGAYDKTGVAAALPALQVIDGATGVFSGEGKPNVSKLPGAGTNTLSAVPFVGNALARSAAKSYGGEHVQQALQVLLNAQIRSQSGQAVSRYEEGRNLLAAGMGPLGDERDVTNGIKLMFEGLQEADKSVRAGYPSDVVEQYEVRGGNGAVSSLFNRKKEGASKEAPAAKKEEAPSGAYTSELNQARRRLGAFRADVGERMTRLKKDARWASAEVDKKKAQVDAYLKEKFGRGYVDAQQ